MENIKNREINRTPKYEPYTNTYSLKNLQTNFDKDNKNQNILKKLLNINQNNYLINNLQKKNSFNELKAHSLKINGFKKFNTERNLQRININTQNNNNYAGQDDYNIIFANKVDTYSKNNGKLNQENNQKLLMNKDIIAKKLLNKNNDLLNNYKKINNQKFYSINNNNRIVINNNNLLLDNNIITKKISNNIIKDNYDLNSTLPNKAIKNNNFTINNNVNLEDNLPNNQKIGKNSNFLNPQNFRNIKNKINTRTMTDYNTKNKVSKNDLSWDYGIGIINKGDQINFYQKNNNAKNKNNYIMNNYLSERKKKPFKFDTDNLSEDDDDIDDKDIDEIVDNLNLSFFDDEKKNNTVILNEKGFSDDSLSVIAGDIIKTFQETENDDLNFQETVPSSSNPEIDGITSNNTDIQFNNNIESQKKIIYETKSTIKPTIVNNFFISNSGEQNNNNSLNKDINYNLFVVNEYNNKINTNNIPTLFTKTYKSPNILRVGKNNQKQNNINDFDVSENDDFNENRNNALSNNNIINNQNIIIGLNYSNQNNNLINSNITNKFNNNEQVNPNNFNPKKESLIENDKNNIVGKNNHKYNINQNINNIQIKRLNSNNLLDKNLKKNSNEMNEAFLNLKDLLSSKKNNNNIEVIKENNNSFNESDKKYLLKNKLKNIGKNNIENINNFSYNKNKSYNNNNITYQNNDKNNIKRITNNMAPINKNNYFKTNINLNRKSIPKIKSKTDLTQNNILIKNKRHISFNLNNNILIKFKKDDLITNSEIITQTGEIYIQPKKNINELKLIKPKPIIKTFLSKDIKINKDYILVENLPERQILPDLYDDFEEEEIKSLEKSLERPTDKILH